MNNLMITVDPRGVGGSGGLDGWTHVLRRQADDVAALLRSIGVDTAVLCGVSYGGVLAQRIALEVRHSARPVRADRVRI